MSQSLFRLLKQSNPEIIIDVLARSWLHPILSRMPEVNNIINIPIDHGELALVSRYKISRSLCKNNYQQAIVLPNSWKSALIPFWAKIKRRTGWFGEARWLLLNDIHYRPYRLKKMVWRYAKLGLSRDMELSETIPLPKLQTKPVKLEISKPVLALCPGAAYGPAKRWPVDKFIEVAQQKITAGWQVWLFGGERDQEITNKITECIHSEDLVDFVNKIGLGYVADLLATVNMVVTNDSGLMHLAAAVNKPLIAIYGATSPKFTPPLGDKAMIIKQELACSPCFQRQCPLQHHKCMQDISSKKVLKLIEETCEY